MERLTTTLVQSFRLDPPQITNGRILNTGQTSEPFVTAKSTNYYTVAVTNERKVVELRHKRKGARLQTRS